MVYVLGLGQRVVGMRLWASITSSMLVPRECGQITLKIPTPCFNRRPSMIKQWMQRIVVTSCVAVALGLSSGRLAEAHSSDDLDQDDHQPEKTLYIWAGDQERVRPDFLAVIDFN